MSVKVYMKLDIKSVYNHIYIKKSDEWKTVFYSQYNYFKYLIMSFELANALTSFQMYINWVLTKYLNIFCIVYLNDILIFSDMKEEYTQHVHKILTYLQKH